MSAWPMVITVRSEFRSPAGRWRIAGLDWTLCCGRHWQLQCLALVALLQDRGAGRDRLENPAVVPFAGAQAYCAVGALVGEHRDALGFARHRADQKTTSRKRDCAFNARGAKGVPLELATAARLDTFG
jgi:hypothetical protein